MSEIELADLKLAVTEVCGNAVQHACHGGPGVVRIVYRVEPEAIEVSVEDEGTGAAFPDVDDAAIVEGPVESGMGLAIVRAVMDEVASKTVPMRKAPSFACASGSRVSSRRLSRPPGSARHRALPTRP